MLVLSRKVGERIQIGDNISVVINRIAGNRVTIGIEAPGDMRIVRNELNAVPSDLGAGETPVAAGSRLSADDFLASPLAGYTRRPR